MLKASRPRYKQLLNKIGVYCIICTGNNKRYIGSTSSGFDNRIHGHLSDLRRNKHHSPYLQYSYNKYGEDSLKFVILKLTNKTLEFETYYLKHLDHEFNVALVPGAPMAGRKHSEKTKIKMSGKTPWNLGVFRTEEEKQRMSIRAREERAKKSPEWKAWISEIRVKSAPRYWKGKKLPEHVAKLNRQRGKDKAQKIVCLNTGTIYNSQLDAAKDLDIRQGHIAEQLNGQRNSASGYKFKKT